MTVITRIILDVDDTLNSLTFPILRHFGCDVGPFEYDKFPTQVGYDVVTACELLGGTVPHISNPDWDGYDEDTEFIQDIPAFWDEVTNADLWRSVPKSPQCDGLLERSGDIVGRENVYIATSPTKDPQSHADKLLWIWDNLPTWIHRQYFITPRKWILGKPGVILFDDHLENCENFIEETGQALLVPRPWNPFFAEDTDDVIAVCLDKIDRELHYVA